MPDARPLPIEAIPAEHLEDVRPLLLHLLTEDQRHYRPSSPADVEALVGPVRPGFSGENLVFGARDGSRLVAFCWCVFFDPGTGYEAEVAEVFVDPEYRGRGLATGLLGAAVEAFRSRGVTFAAVWTHPSNEQAMAMYRSAGFRPTEQVVLTWLPAGG